MSFSQLKLLGILVKKKIDNSIDFLRLADKTKQVFHFLFAKVGKVQANSVWNEPWHKTHTIVTYHYETLLVAPKTKFRRLVWRFQGQPKR